MTAVLFFIPCVIFFWAFAYFFHNPDFAVEYRAWLSGPLFAVGISPLFLFHESESRVRVRAMLIWFLGMVAGIALAAYLYAHLLPEVPA